jgi:uncharacterized membrane protein YdjX (TVP38/TMEM64 family)
MPVIASHAVRPLDADLSRQVRTRPWMLIPIALLAGAIWIAWRRGYFDLEDQRSLMLALVHAGQRGWAPLVYVTGFAAAVMLCLPTSLCLVIGGAAFGFTKGIVLGWLGALLGTAGAWRLARSRFGVPLQRVFTHHPLLRRLSRTVRTVTIVRLRALPLAPFGVLDYVAGFVGVPLRRLLIATAVGVVPTVIAYTFVGNEWRVGLQDSSALRARALWIAGGITALLIAASFLVSKPQR